MSIRSMLVVGAFLVCGACVWFGGPPNAALEPELAVAEAQAQTACPVEVADAYAWVNRMPSIGERSTQLNVTARLKDSRHMAVLTRSPASTAERLVLDVRVADTAPIPGQMAYREAAPNPVYTSVEFACRGGLVFRLDEIESVF